jgi:hypothetical protein
VSQGVRVAKGVYLLTAHGVAQEAGTPAYKGITLKAIFVNGRECDVGLKGSPAYPWTEDLAIVKTKIPRKTSPSSFQSKSTRHAPYKSVI